MSYRSLRFTLAFATAVLSTGAAFAQEKVVHVYNWSDYIDPSILEDFTKETGIKVVYDVYDGNEVLETKLLAGNSGYDVVAPTSPFLARQIKGRCLSEARQVEASELKNMWPEITTRLAQYDPGNEYAVNYMWGTTGIGYNVAKVKAALGEVKIDSWDVLFQAGKCQEAAILRHQYSRRFRRDLCDCHELHRQESRQQGHCRSRGWRRCLQSDPPLREDVQLIGLYR